MLRLINVTMTGLSRNPLLFGERWLTHMSFGSLNTRTHAHARTHAHTHARKHASRAIPVTRFHDGYYIIALACRVLMPGSKT